MKEQGATFQEIAEALGISYGKARHLCVKAGVQNDQRGRRNPRTHGLTEEGKQKHDLEMRRRRLQRVRNWRIKNPDKVEAYKRYYKNL
jgi:hypothetical protein